MGGMQVLRRGGGEIVLSVITTQMFQGPSLLTNVRAHVGKHETIIIMGHNKLEFEQEGQRYQASNVLFSTLQVADHI